MTYPLMEGCRFLLLSLLLSCVPLGGWLHCFTVENREKVNDKSLASYGCRSLAFLKFFGGHALQRHVFKEIYLPLGVEPNSDCKNRCLMENACVSVNIGPSDKNGLRVCQLSDSDHTQHPNDLKPHEGYLYWASKNSCSSKPCGQSMPCINGFNDKRYICPGCQVGFKGERCEQDINECIINAHGCHYNASCNNTIGSYTCKCKLGLNCTFKAVFTNLNATGRYGPTALGSHYVGQDHDGQVTLSSGIQQWTVPYTGDYKIEAIGAAGGYDPFFNSAQYRGRGTRMIGTFRLNKGEVIKILCGQEGGISKREWSSGGGGGTFIVRGANTPLVIAGGGGGVQSVRSRHGGCDASTQTTGNSGYKSWSGGSNGHGAQDSNDSFSGGGGGGFCSNGRNGLYFNGTKGNGGEGGKGFLQGGVGGRARYFNTTGGFGGGGGAWGWGGGGGGGGGYSGGGSGKDLADSCGGGGGSFNAGDNQQNDCCYNFAGHGHVTITLL